MGDIYVDPGPNTAGDVPILISALPPVPGPAEAPKYDRPGPSRQPGIGAKTSPAPSIFENYPGPRVDAAKTIIKQYMSLLGWPQSVDTEQMALDLLQNNLENKPQESFEHFWQSKFLTDDMRKASPWARFGKDADTFHQDLASMQDLIHRTTGIGVQLDPGLVASADSKTPDAMSQLLQNALKFGWGQQQIMDTFQAGSFTNNLTGDKVDLTQITSAQPWLLSGQTYQQQAQQFHTIYGAAPVDTDQLAGWYRFNQSAAQMGPWYAKQAVISSPGKMPTAVGQTEVR